jgi:hypothetical protein
LPLPEPAQRKALAQRNAWIARHFGDVDKMLSQMVVTSTDLAALLKIVEADETLVHAAYYTDDACIASIADWIAPRPSAAVGALAPILNPAPGVILLNATLQGASFEVSSTRPLLRMGRGRENDLVVSDTFASSTHAQIECRGNRVFLVDQSLNGTSVCVHGMQDVVVAKREILLEGSGLIGLGRSPTTEPTNCICFEIRTQIAPRCWGR